MLLALGLCVLAVVLIWLWIRYSQPGGDVEILGHEGVEVAGRFIRGQRAGLGSLGVVYEAWDKKMERHVALKKLHDILLQKPADGARFAEHAKAATTVKHPGIVELYEVFFESAGVFYAGAFVKGKTLHQLLGEKGRFKPAEIFELLKPVAQALQFAHAGGVIHGGIKPLNLIVPKGGSQPLIMDIGMPWGIPNAVSSRPGTSSMGTYPYQPPEQEDGMISPSTDFYSLAVCAYQLMTGELPFSGPKMRGLKAEGKFPAPEEIEPELPKTLDSFFRKALASNPDLRFKSADEFLAALKK